MNYLHIAMQWFFNLEAKRKINLLVLTSFILISTSYLCWWALSPSYAILFHDLEEQDTQKIITQLEQENISYQLNQEGKDILIDKNLVTKTRLKIMSSGLQWAGTVGFELFDKSDFGMTQFSQKINYQRALQGELERTISSMSEVRQARVHLLIPESHLFQQEENQPKAAVTLHLKQAINQHQVKSIQQLIAASVAHLNVKNVVVVDQNGTTLSKLEEDNASNHFLARQKMELYLNHKVDEMLHQIFPQQQLIVRVNADINFDELQRELIKPQSKGQVSHEKESSHSTLDKKGKNKGQQDLSREKTYELGSEKEWYKRANGTIERLSISVVLPEKTSENMLTKIQNLIKSTVGFNEQRGDVISVEALIAEPVLKKSKIESVSAQPIPTLSIAEKEKILLCLIALLTLGSCSTLLLIRRVRQKKRQQLLLELTQWLNQHE